MELPIILSKRNSMESRQYLATVACFNATRPFHPEYTFHDFAKTWDQAMDDDKWWFAPWIRPMFDNPSEGTMLYLHQVRLAALSDSGHIIDRDKVLGPWSEISDEDKAPLLVIQAIIKNYAI